MTEEPDFVRAALRQLVGKQVLCLGDIMLDRFIYGDVERISPEAPVPVLRIAREMAIPGGAGNVLRNLLAFRAEVTFFAIVGDDQPGRELTTLVGNESRVEAHILVEPARKTTVKTRFVASGQHLLRVDDETIAQPNKDVLHDLIQTAIVALPSVDAIAIADYGKGILTPATLRQLIDAATTRHKPVVVDPKGPDFSRYRGAALITPNLAELRQATALPCESEAEIVAAANSLIQHHDFSAVVVTRGAAGLSLIQAGSGCVHHIPAQAREVFDVSGAGDTVAAMFALGLAAGLPHPRTALLANLAAGVVVSKLGTATARPEEVIANHESTTSSLGNAKVRSCSSVREQVRAWRLEGLRVVLTNGVFDLLHPGHLSLLSQAKAQGDRLIVAINSDRSARALKGPSRPVQDEMARARLLGALEMVDSVTIFDEETPLALIEALSPDILVKGADYHLDQVVGRAIVERTGGRVCLIPLTENQSTTTTINRIIKPDANNADGISATSR